MAFTPSSFLNNTSTVLLRDPQHASRVFVSDQFRLAPKHKFLFHVAFGINRSAVAAPELVERYKNEINVLVKSVDLPNYTVTVETLNQYNRKKNVQTTHRYNPINIIFHDDNMGLINALWQNYYSYYYADPISATAPGAYNRTATKNWNYINNTFGLDNGSTQPFFNYIIIYQMARHEFVSYTLQNPIISSFNHNRMDYAQAGTHDNTMQISYEAVAYGSGIVTEGNPEGFALEHYDKTPSPLVSAGLGDRINPSLTEQGTDISQEKVSVLSQQLNTYQNTKDKESPATSGNVSLVQTAPQNNSGLPGFQFPIVSTNRDNPTPATPINLG